MEYEIRNCSVLDAGADVIVNAANNNLTAGGGVCGAIFSIAGFYQLSRECSKYGYVETGSAVITSGCNSGARYIVHAVGPNYTEDTTNWQEKLESAYINALKVGDIDGVTTIAFPCISVGIYACPIDKATKIAIDVVSNYEPKNLTKCILCCYTNHEFLVYKKEEGRRK